MTKDEIIKKLRDMAKYPTVTLPRDCEALKAAAALLAQQEAKDEPVAYGMWDTMIGKGNRMMYVRLGKGQDGCTVPLYTTPPQRKPLTDEEIQDALEAEFLGSEAKRNWQDDLRVARAIEAAHGIKGEA
jgi:hypothetical protein